MNGAYPYSEHHTRVRSGRRGGRQEVLRDNNAVALTYTNAVAVTKVADAV